MTRDAEHFETVVRVFVNCTFSVFQWNCCSPKVIVDFYPCFVVYSFDKSNVHTDAVSMVLNDYHIHTHGLYNSMELP